MALKSAVKRVFINSQAGLSLLETLTAIIIMGIIVVAFLNLFSINFLQVYVGGERDQALNLAMRTLEELYAQDPVQNLNFGDEVTISYQKAQIDNQESTFIKVIIEVPYQSRGNNILTLKSYFREEQWDVDF